MLLGQVNGSGLSRGRKSCLDAKLLAAENSLSRNKPRVAANQLSAFANEVRAMKRARILSANLADLWLFEVESIMALVIPAKRD